MELRRTGWHAERIDALLCGARPAETPDDRQVLAAAAALRGWPAPTLRPDFRASLRVRLLAEPMAASTSAEAGSSAEAATAEAATDAVRNAGESELRPPARSGGRRAARLARPALVGALASSVAVAGITVSARSAMPGDPLYGVKLRIEQIQITLAGSDTARAKAHLDVARTRMGEMQSLLNTRPDASDAAAEMPALLAAWQREAESGSDVLVGQARDGDEDAHTTMADFTADQSEELTTLVEELPEGDAQLIAEQALAYIQDVGSSLATSSEGSPGAGGLLLGPDGSPSAGENATATASPTQTAGASTSPTPSASATLGDPLTLLTPPVPTPAVPGGQLTAPSSPGVADPTISAPPLPLPTATSGLRVDGQVATQGLGSKEQPAG